MINSIGLAWNICNLTCHEAGIDLLSKVYVYPLFSFVLTGLIASAALPYLGVQITELSLDDKAEILFLDQAYDFFLYFALFSAYSFGLCFKNLLFRFELVNQLCKCKNCISVLNLSQSGKRYVNLLNLFFWVTFFFLKFSFIIIVLDEVNLSCSFFYFQFCNSCCTCNTL